MSESKEFDVETESAYSSSVLGPAEKIGRKHSSADLSGSVFLIAGDGRMLKLPIPSQSLRDPLGWSQRKRVGIFVAMMFFSVVSLFALAIPAFLQGGLKKDFGNSQDIGPFSFESLNSISSLWLGIGAVFWIPFSIAVGRRPVLLLCIFLFTIAMAWAAVSKSLSSLICAVSLAGMAGGVALSTMLLVVIDTTFIHERPQAIAMWFSLGASITLAIVAFLHMSQNLLDSWRPFYSVWVAPSLISMALVFFFVPETYFFRPPIAFDGQILIQTGAERIRIYEESSCPPCAPQGPGQPSNSRFRTWFRSLKLFSTTGGSWKSAVACCSQMLLCIANPMIFWVVIMNAVNFGGMMSIGATFPALLSSAPYNLPPYVISLVNLAASAGALLAWPASGIIIGRITKRLATSNGGVRQAEYLLPGYVLPVLSGAASVFIYGVVAEYHYHFLWVYLAYGLDSFSFVSMSVANTLWVTEAFPYWAAAALAVVGGFSYIASFTMSSMINKWLEEQGYFWVNAEIGIGLIVLGFVSVPMAFWGKSIRQYIHGRWGIDEAGALRPQ